MPPSARSLDELPGIDELRRLLQSLAMLDAILSPEWEDRWYSFNSRWSAKEQMGSMRTGSRDEFFALFNKAGVFLKGFAHESPMADPAVGVWPGVLEGIPVEFKKCAKEPAFNMSDTTFCLWRRATDMKWQRGEVAFPPKSKDPDGSGEMLKILDGKPGRYKAWAEDNYECKVSLAAVNHIYQHKPLSEEIVQRLNPESSLDDLADDVKEIGYPSS